MQRRTVLQSSVTCVRRRRRSRFPVANPICAFLHQKHRPIGGAQRNAPFRLKALYLCSMLVPLGTSLTPFEQAVLSAQVTDSQAQT
jgi:hypothetical protein